MKKAFTLIEIIFSIVLIVVVGTSAFFIINEKSSNKLETIEDEILTSANIYISVETDEDGKNFLNGINSGGRGVIIPLTKLVEKGYLSDEIVNTIEENYQLEQHYVLALLGDGSLNNDCSDVTLTISWDETYTKEVYLCPISSADNESEYSVSFIVDNRCEGGTSFVELFDSDTGYEYTFPDNYCSNALESDWIDLYRNKYNAGDEVIITKSGSFQLVPTFPTLDEKLTDLGIEKNKYFSATSSNNYVTFANKLWNMVYYGENGLKLVLKGHIGSMKGNIGTLEQGDERISSLKQKLDEWYKLNLEYEYDEFILTSDYCNNIKNKISVLSIEELEEIGVFKNTGVDGNFLTLDYNGYFEWYILNEEYCISPRLYASFYGDGILQDQFAIEWDNYEIDVKIRPVITISKNLSVIGGDGTILNPYKFGYDNF